MTVTKATLTIGGDERDVTIRASTFCERQFGGSWGASVDGGIEVELHGEWLPLEDLDVDAKDIERATDALCDEANQDDSDQCVEWPEVDE